MSLAKGYAVDRVISCTAVRTCSPATIFNICDKKVCSVTPLPSWCVLLYYEFSLHRFVCGVTDAAAALC